MADRPLLVPLDTDAGHGDDGSLLGGKAVALGRVVAAGHPVPRSVVVTTEAYRSFSASPSIRSLVARLRDPRGDDVVDDEIDRAFLHASMPDEVRSAIDAAASTFDGPLAVRSSATSEDLAGSAFAGQYRSLLDVDPCGLEHAIRLVWASLWHDAPRAYRRLRDIDDREPAMAVLVMDMVQPELAGVLFTRDPVRDESNVHLETVAGCAEMLVSGAVTPDAYGWPRDEAAKVAGERLGPAIGELVARGLQLEASCGAPLDIEFAVDRAGRLWLVQARPITTLTPPRVGTLTRAGIAEMLPGALPPLLRGTAGRHVDEGFRELLASLGADLDASVGDEALVRFERSRARLDLSLLRRAAATVPGGSVTELDRGYGATGPSPSERATRSTALQVARVMRHRRAAVLEAEVVDQAADRLTEDDGRRGDESLADLLAHWERVQDLGARATAAEMAVAALATASYEGAERVLGRHVGAEAAAGVVQQLTARPVSAAPLDRCLRAVGADPGDEAFAERWRRALARSGSRSVFGGPTWAEDPDLAHLSFEAARAERPTGSATRDPLATLAHAPGTRDLALSRTRRRFVRREAADAAELLDRRERTKQALLDVGGIAHRLTLEIADRLAGAGVLSTPSDVWLLTPDELRAACSSGVAPSDFADRRTRFERDRAADDAEITRRGGDRGWPASPGRGRGRAVVVATARADAIEPGDVLVARHTDASWVPLFARAGAIVVEEGGPLSHAAIVARELGVPAVVNMPGIVDRIRRAGPGVVVEVDGTNGSVVIVEAVTVDPLVPVIGPPEPELRVGVFVTGLIGASALLGAIVSITETVSSARGIRRTRARAATPAAVVADVVRHGTDAAANASTGLLPAHRYGRAAVAMLAVGLLVTGHATFNYALGESGGRIVWLVAALSTLAATVAGTGLARSAQQRWPDVPPVVRRITPHRRLHIPVREVWHEVPALHRRWFVVFGATSLVLLIANLVAPWALRAVDEPIYDAIGAPRPDPWGPEWFGMYFGRPQVVIPVALLVALFTLRCRVLAIAYPLTIMFGGILNMGLGALVGKERPPLGAHADQTDSFPSGHAIEVTLLFGLAPLAVAVLLRSSWAGALGRGVASGLLAVMLVDGVREGSHWPTDHLGGFAIAMTAVVAVHALARAPSLHRSPRCPAMSLVADGRGDPGRDP